MMTRDEFLSAMKSRGAILAPGVAVSRITRASSDLQRIHMAMIPAFMTDLYGLAGGLNLGTGYIFGPTEFSYSPLIYPTPDIVKVNEDIRTMPAIAGKSVFGRNDLFWFGFDAFGVCYMLDNLTLRPLRKYDDVYRALSDCLLGGKI